MNMRRISFCSTAGLGPLLVACNGKSERHENTATGAALGGAAVGGVIGNQADPKQQ